VTRESRQVESCPVFVKSRPVAGTWWSGGLGRSAAKQETSQSCTARMGDEGKLGSSFEWGTGASCALSTRALSARVVLRPRKWASRKVGQPIG